MNKSCVFLQEYLGLPAVYMAGTRKPSLTYSLTHSLTHSLTSFLPYLLACLVKKTIKDKEGNDKEILVYTAASNGQEHVRGKTLERPPESEEEGASNGKGCSFDVFKVSLTYLLTHSLTY